MMRFCAVVIEGFVWLDFEWFVGGKDREKMEFAKGKRDFFAKNLAGWENVCNFAA